MMFSDFSRLWLYNDFLKEYDLDTWYYFLIKFPKSKKIIENLLKYDSKYFNKIKDIYKPIPSKYTIKKNKRTQENTEKRKD